MPQDPRQRDGCRFTAQNITAAQEKNPFAKISDIVYELLEKAIFSSAIPPGSKLNISKLAEQMGVSTSPVTRAVERLEENGLVTAVRSSDSKYRSYFVLTSVASPWRTCSWPGGPSKERRPSSAHRSGL